MLHIGLFFKPKIFGHVVSYEVFFSFSKDDWQIFDFVFASIEFLYVYSLGFFRHEVRTV